LKNIECYLNENVKWSDGTPITTEDIYTTYNTIKGQNTDIILTSLLSSTTIEYTDNIIRFKNNSEDVNFLNVFFQPIVAKKVLDNLSNLELSGNFPTSN
jgi:ABC-type transport system substrate-binding protein